MLLFDVDRPARGQRIARPRRRRQGARPGRPPAARPGAAGRAGRPGRRRRVRCRAAHRQRRRGAGARRTRCAPDSATAMVIDALTLDVDTDVGVSIYPDHGTEPRRCSSGPTWPPPWRSRRRDRPAVQRRACSPVRCAGSGSPPICGRAQHRRARGLLPAQGRAQGPAAGRRRMPGPLGASGARPGRPAGLRLRRRAHRPARPAQRRGAPGRHPPRPANGPTPAARSPSRSTSPPGR